jgi:hypothetical protein
MKEFVDIIKYILKSLSSEQAKIKSVEKYLSLVGYRNLSRDLRTFWSWFVYSLVQQIFTYIYVNNSGSNLIFLMNAGGSSKQNG